MNLEIDESRFNIKRFDAADEELEHMMRQEQFLAMMPYISTDLVTTIVGKQNVSEEEAIKKLYDSRLYAALEDEKTKVWQYSTSMLYSLLVQEEKSGDISFPDV